MFYSELKELLTIGLERWKASEYRGTWSEVEFKMTAKGMQISFYGATADSPIKNQTFYFRLGDGNANEDPEEFLRRVWRFVDGLPSSKDERMMAAQKAVENLLGALKTANVDPAVAAEIHALLGRHHLPMLMPPIDDSIPSFAGA